MKVMTIEEILIRVNNAMKIGEYNLAGDLLNKIISTKPDFFLPYMLLGNVYERTGKTEKALLLYKQSIRLKPDNVEAYNNLGITYKKIKKYNEALAFLNRALLLDPHRADILYNIGNIYKETGNPGQAIQQYEKSIEIDPRFVPAYINLGTVLEMLKKYDVAGQVYTLGLEVDANNPKLHYNLGIIYERQDKLKQARLEFELALKAKPGWSDALLNLGIVLSKLAEHNKSIDTYQSILKTDPVNVKAINNLGIEHTKLNDIEKARGFFHKAIGLDPDYHKAHFNLGTLLEDQGEYKQALMEIENCIKMNPDDIPARFRLGNIYTELGKYRQAEIQFRSILKLNPGNGETLRALGNLYLRTGKYEEANKCYSQLSGIHPDMEDYHLDFAVLLNDKKEFEKSEAEIKKFLSANPEDMNAQCLLGELYFKQDLLKNASGLFEQIIEKKPHIVKPYYYLAKTYEKMGNTEKAIETIDKLITVQGNRGTHTDIENLNKTIELYEKATKEYEKSFKVKLHKDIAQLDDFSYDTGGDTGSMEDPDLMYVVEDTGTIIKTGGIEPVIPVKEVVEQVKIVETTKEESTAPVVELEDSEPLPFSDLLKNQELYEALPALTSKLLEQTKEQKDFQESLMKQFKGKSGQDLSEQLKDIDKQDILEQLKERNKQDLPGQFMAKNEQNGAKQLKEQEAPLIAKQLEDEKNQDGLPPYEFQNKGTADEKLNAKTIPPGLLDSMANKIDSIAEKAKGEKGFTFKPGDKADEVLLDVIKNISRAFKEGIKPGISPAYYFPVRKKRQTSVKKKQDFLKQESLDEYLRDKARTTRARLKEFFGNVRKKLDAGQDIKIPEDKKKQENIQSLVKKILGSKPFEDDIKQQTLDKLTSEKDRKKEESNKSRKQVMSPKITKDQEKEDTAIDLKTDEPAHVMEIDLNIEPELKEEFTKEEFTKEEFTVDESDKECQETIEKASDENKWDEHYKPEKMIKATDKFPEKEPEKSFKPRIRLPQRSVSRSIIIKTLEFVRRLLSYVLNTGIKNRFDDFIRKMKKR